jgi:hypothetical protein
MFCCYACYAPRGSEIRSTRLRTSEGNCVLRVASRSLSHPLLCQAARLNAFAIFLAVLPCFFIFKVIIPKDSVSVKRLSALPRVRRPFLAANACQLPCRALEKWWLLWWLLGGCFGRFWALLSTLA